MLKKLTLLLFISTLIILSNEASAQSPWIPKAKGGFAQVGYSGLFYSQARIGSEVLETGQLNRDFTYQLYVDYGLGKKIGLTAILPIKQTYFIKDDVKQSLNGLGNLQLGLKYLVLDKDSKVSIGIQTSFRTGQSDHSIGLRTGYEAFTAMPYITVGTGTNKMYFYANLGYGYRTNGYSDFAKLSGEMGYKLNPRVIVAGTLDLNRPLNDNSSFYQNESPAFFLSSNYLDRQLFNGVGIKAIVDIKPDKYGFIISSIGSLAAENIPFSRSYNVGVFLKY